MITKVLFTGGGTLGHASPNVPLIEECLNQEIKVSYIGSYHGPEKKLIEKILGVNYFGIPSGKFRRYFSFQNFTDIFKICAGIFKSILILIKERPDVVFSKGGYVSLPVVVAAFLLRIKIVVHESDMSFGLTSKLSIPLANKVCTGFKIHQEDDKFIFTGTPLRKEFLVEMRKNKEEKKSSKSILFVGGSSGANKINELVYKLIEIDELQGWEIYHICGKGNINNKIKSNKYNQFEFVNEEYASLLNSAEIVVSRAGATSITEILLLKKLNILIPLPLSSSRGDQIENASYFNKQGMSKVIQEDNLTPEIFITELNSLIHNKNLFLSKINSYGLVNSIDKILKVLINSKT